MANLHKYVESSAKDGYYLRDGYDGTIVTYQISDFAEKLLLDLGYEDESNVAGEVFYILLNLDLIFTNRSGIEPVESLDELPDPDSDKISDLSDKQRKNLVDMLLKREDLTSNQESKLTRYAKMDNFSENNSNHSDTESDSNNLLFDSRVKDYDEYMIAVDTRRLLKPAVERLDIEDHEDSPLLARLESAGDRQRELYEKCKDHPKNLRVYRNEQGIPDGVRVFEKRELNKDGLAVPTGSGETIKISYDIPAKNHDIVVPDGWTVPPIRSNGNNRADDILFEDLPNDTQNELINQAHKEVLQQVVEFIEDM